QSFWLTPTVIASGFGLENSKAAEQLKALREKTSAKRHVQIFVNPESALEPWGDATPKSDNTLTFADQDEDVPTTLKFRAATFDFEPSVGAKVERLSQANFAGDVPTQGFGLDATLFNGRFQFSSDIAQPIDQTDRRDFRDTQLRDSDRSIR